MSKITPEHLARQAVVYIRQSTADQVANNQESRRRQYGLADRARQLGWNDVAVIDDDLGRSGGGVARPGFEKLLAAICEGRVGAVVSIEASRLARNGRDWHTLLEFCGLVGTLIVDEDGVYDPRHPNDRLLLGMKGTMSEMELSVLRQRSLEALKQKARRGELFMTVAIGYVRVGHNRIEKDPDRRIQRSHRARLHQVRRDAIGSAGASVVPARACVPAGRHPRGGRSRDRVEAAGLQHHPAHPDQPDLRRRLRVRADGQPCEHRGRSQEDHPRLQEGAEGLGSVDPESPRGLCELDGLREEPAPDRGQHQRHGADEPRRTSPGRGVARRPAALWPLRTQAACRLLRHRRQHRALPLPGRPLQSRRRPLHLVRGHAHRSRRGGRR